MESRTQGARLRPRAQTKKSKAKDTPSEDRPSRGQGQECSRTKYTTRKCSPKKKKKRNFEMFLKKYSSKNDLQNYFSLVFWLAPRRNNIAHDLGPFSTSKKVGLSTSRGQGILKNLQASRTWPSKPRPRTSNICVLEDTTSDQRFDCTSKIVDTVYSL